MTRNKKLMIRAQHDATLKLMRPAHNDEEWRAAVKILMLGTPCDAWISHLEMFQRGDLRVINSAVGRESVCCPKPRMVCPNRLEYTLGQMNIVLETRLRQQSGVGIYGVRKPKRIGSNHFPSCRLPCGKPMWRQNMPILTTLHKSVLTVNNYNNKFKYNIIFFILQIDR